MKLMTKTVAKKLPTLRAQENASDPVVHAKFFNPCGAATWYVLEFDGEDTFFGYVNLGDHDNAELGYFSLAELQSIRVFGGRLGIERDLHWDPTPLSKVLNGEVR